MSAKRCVNDAGGCYWIRVKSMAAQMGTSSTPMSAIYELEIERSSQVQSATKHILTSDACGWIYKSARHLVGWEYWLRNDLPQILEMLDPQILLSFRVRLVAHYPLWSRSIDDGMRRQCFPVWSVQSSPGWKCTFIAYRHWWCSLRASLESIERSYWWGFDDWLLVVLVKGKIN